jgi:hypothetical protein
VSYQNFEKAMLLAQKCKFYTTAGGKTRGEILKSEDLLGIKFSKQCLEFYKRYGYLSFFGSEIFGIDPDDDSGILEGNSVAYALNDRKKYHLPLSWVPIYNYEDGNMAYLDFSNRNPDGEPRVIMCMHTREKYEMIEVIAEDFGDFLLQLVEQQLSTQ